jgi:predicted transcriptional regulator
MSVPCEVAVKCVLPVVRAMIARELMYTYGLRQVEAAKLLGVSQPAISLYSRSIRGKAIDLENDGEIRLLVAHMTESLAKGPVSHRDLILMYCGICKAIRAKGLLCKLHKAFDPSVEIEKCELCVAGESVECV